MFFKRIFQLIQSSTRPKRWRDRSYKNRDNVLYKILKILKFLSGNDLYFMFYDLFRYSKTFESKYIARVSRESYALKKIALKLNSRIKPKNKHHFLRMFKYSGFSLEEVKDIGFKVGLKLWKTCSDKKERNVGGRPAISNVFKRLINEHFKNNSNPSSYRNAVLIKRKPLVKKKNEVKTLPRPQSTREIKNCHFLNNTISELQKSFPYNRQTLWRGVPTLFPSRASFFRNRLANFKKPRLKTDLCEYCCVFESLRKNVDFFIKEIHPNIWREKFDIEFYLTQFNVTSLEVGNIEYPNDADAEINSDDEVNFVQTDNERETLYNSDTNQNNVVEQLKLLKQIDYHKYIAERTHRTYLRLTDLKSQSLQVDNIDFYKNNVLLEFDYKQKIVFGLGPESKSYQYFNQKQASCFGVGVYYFNLEKNKLETIRVNIFSDCLSQDGEAVVRNLKFLRSKPFFRQIMGEKKQITIFCDVGTHFRNRYLNHYLFRELKDEGIRVNLNYFIEKHGKSKCDSHFSSLNKYMNIIRKREQINCIDDLIISLEEQHKNSNENKALTKRKLITMVCFKNNPPFVENRKERKELPNISGFVIPQLKCYYNLHVNEKLELKTTILPADIPYKCIIFDLFTPPTSSHKLPFYRSKKSHPDQIVKEKIININTNCGSKERFYIEMQGINTRINIDATRNEVSTINQDLPTPKYCITTYNCENCEAKISFELDRIRTLGKLDLENELFKHGHKKCLFITKNRQRNVAEAREELKNHYLKFHHLT